ncbi:MAG TPA: hypothetical protein VLA51_04975 [Paracoccaceae bacterium]|nr:hypothetical protein [Paracoccaceae bacterium]
MSKARDLQVRLRAATDTINESIGGIAALVPALDNLQAENKRLKRELAELHARRKEDLDHLDQLLDQLRPLVSQEGENA